MAQVNVQVMQWNRLNHIADLKPVGDDDADCLKEIRSVLERHNALDRFGVTLLHSHFDLAEDEMMLETTDVDKREHYVRPVKRSFFDGTGVTAQTTVVGFDTRGYTQVCGCDPR